MNLAVPPNETGMAALIGLPANKIQKIIDTNNLKLEIANDNSEIQIVISGNIEDLKKSRDFFLKNNVKKFILLNVSAAFHSKYMIDAQKKLAEEIDKLTFKKNKIKIISNYDANIHDDNIVIKKNLKNQMANRVNWTQKEKKNLILHLKIGKNSVLSVKKVLQLLTIKILDYYRGILLKKEKLFLVE